MLVLGINYGFHDPSAAVVEDGVLLALTEQERFSRKKHARLEMPIDAVRACLRQAGVEPEQIDAIGTGWNIDRFSPPLPPAPHRELDRALPPEFSRPLQATVQHVDHHVAHAASALWSSGFADAAILIVDGQAERESTSIGYGDASGIRMLASYPVNASFGHFYRAATQYAGLERPGSRGEGKLMGLAAYGQPRDPMPLLFGEGRFSLAPEVTVPHTADTRTEMRDVLREMWRNTVFPFCDGNGAEPMAYVHFAASVQNAVEDALESLVHHARRLTGSRQLVVAGGVAQNCSANARIAASGAFDDYYFLPVAHDSGASLGAALHVAHAQATATGARFAPIRLEHAYWGNSYSDAEVSATIREQNLPARRMPEAELLTKVASDIAEGRLIGWFSGRAEVGPRALGARSMLADPRRREVVARLNEIKGREIWRPLAPSVLAERFDDYFEAPLPSPFMNLRAMVRPEMQDRIAAVVHVDGSARPQAVDANHSPRYWSLIKEYERLTGVPVVLNTSFNLAGEPIVYSPSDAVRTFLNSKLDVLVLDGWVIDKREMTDVAS